MTAFRVRLLVEVTSQDYPIGSTIRELILGGASVTRAFRGIIQTHLFNGFRASIQSGSDLASCVIVVDVHSCGLRRCIPFGSETLSRSCACANRAVNPEFAASVVRSYQTQCRAASPSGPSLSERREHCAHIIISTGVGTIPTCLSGVPPESLRPKPIRQDSGW